MTVEQSIELLSNNDKEIIKKIRNWAIKSNNPEYKIVNDEGLYILMGEL